MKKIFATFFILTLVSLIFNPFIHADEAVSVAVPPRQSDFQFAFSSTSPQPLQQKNDATYQVTYGAYRSSGMALTETIVASWAGASAPDGSQLLDYEIGSASSGYGGVSPIVDTTHKTITWTIINLPQGTTNQTLTFKLKPISSYNKPNAFSFNVTATMSNQFQTLPMQSLTQSYQYAGSTSTLTPTIATAITPTVIITSAPIATASARTTLAFNTISFSGVTDTGATVGINTSKQTKITILYGTTSSNLNRKISKDTYALSQSANLPELAPDTTYYFRVVATTASGKTITSDIFTFRTAKHSSPPNVQNNIIVLSSNGNVFSSSSQQENDTKHPSIILTDNTDDTIAYTLTNQVAVRTVEIIVTKKVLAASTTSNVTEAGQYIFPMQAKTTTLYTANLSTLPQGSYDVAIRITDINGNVLQKHISDLKIMPHLIVYGADTHTPLADARIYLSYYDKQTNSYQPVTSALFGDIKNPSYTDSLGQSAVTLPAGTYRIEESSLFYDPQTRDFIIGTGANQNFPIVYLKRDPLNLISLFTYTKNYFEDSWTKMFAILAETSSSIRIFHLVALGILGTFVLLTFFFFLFRSHLALKHLPVFVFFHVDFLRNKHTNRYVFGSIVDEKNNPVSRVRIEIEDAGTQNILTHGSSHKSGKFYITNTFANPINLICTKEGYEPITVTIDDRNALPANGLTVTMKQGKPHHETLASAFMTGVEEGFGMLFETFLVGSFIMEVLFIFFLRNQITLPFFFTLSLLNILLWMFYVKERN